MRPILTYPPPRISLPSGPGGDKTGIRTVFSPVWRCIAWGFLGWRKQRKRNGVNFIAANAGASKAPNELHRAWGDFGWGLLALAEELKQPAGEHLTFFLLLREVLQ